MTIHLLPDVESIVIAYLRDHDDVLDLVDAHSIASEMPAKAGYPFLQAFVVSDPVLVERFMVRARIQLDGWCASRQESRDLCRTAQAALAEMAGPQNGLGVVTGVESLGAARPLFDPPRQRVRFTADSFVTVHTEPDEIGS